MNSNEYFHNNKMLSGPFLIIGVEIPYYGSYGTCGDKDGVAGDVLEVSHATNTWK